MFYRLIGLSFVLMVAAAAAAPAFAAGDDTPQWLLQAASASAPAYDKDVPAVVLLNDQTVTIGANGLIITTTNYAVRILTHEGRAFAVASQGYATDGGRVRDMRAWLIRSTGNVKRYGKNEIIDRVSDMDDVYNESRVSLISASDDADAGMTFGYQVTSEERSLFPQDEWIFQDCFLGINACLPALVSRYQLMLPSGWSASSVTFNHNNKLEPNVNGSSYSWQLINLPPIAPEAASPEVTSLAPRLAVSYFPAQAGGLRTFSNWVDVSRWYSELSDPQAAPDDALAMKAQQLTASAKTELEKIRAIGRYVQGLQYISVQMGVGRFRPHSATEVFAKSYGDCKDKANLMRAMLRAVKIQAYPVLIYSGDRSYVREEWASPKQFNHCIIAIKVSDETQAPTIVQHPGLGRLLIFDATDPSTLVGDLPEDEQGSFALVAAGDQGSLLRMPMTPPESNHLERQTEVSLAPDGSINATVQEHSAGQSAARERGMFRQLSRPEYTKMIERWVTRGATGARVLKVEPKDNTTDASFALKVEFTAPEYGQLMQNRLLVFKPAIISRRESLFLTEATRKQPVVLPPYAYRETANIKLPAGFEVDELPDPTKLDTSFGTYSTTYEVKDGSLIFTRTLVQRASTVPVADYQKVRGFYERIRAAEQSPVVLAKK
ncbi:MAG TPA: transglutaminase domain-containing protein [Pyrinomonadaceae bacterium]|jgi:hypothetical protein